MIHCLQSLVLFIAAIGSSSDLIYCLVLLLLLLLSGDVELNPGPIPGNHIILATLKINTLTHAGNTPSTILRMNYATLVDAITNNLYDVTNGLYAKRLIPMETVNHIQMATGISQLLKSSQLVSVVQKQLELSDNAEQYLADVCHVLMNQQHFILTDIATSILHQLGEWVCV